MQVRLEQSQSASAQVCSRARYGALITLGYEHETRVITRLNGGCSDKCHAGLSSCAEVVSMKIHLVKALRYILNVLPLPRQKTGVEGPLQREPSTAAGYHPLTIDEYLRKRLMPVEGAIPHLTGIEMYGNSIPAGIVRRPFRVHKFSAAL